VPSCLHCRLHPRISCNQGDDEEEYDAGEGDEEEEDDEGLGRAKGGGGAFNATTQSTTSPSAPPAGPASDAGAPARPKRKGKVVVNVANCKWVTATPSPDVSWVFFACLGMLPKFPTSPDSPESPPIVAFVVGAPPPVPGTQV
jgi:hypothetical protein